MKNKLTTFIVCILMGMGLSSCELTRPISASSNPRGTKIGQSNAIGILMFPPFIGFGNAGVLKAAQNGNITHISTVDYTTTWYIFFTRRTCTVTGE